MLYDVWQTENAESPRAAGGGGYFGYWMRKGERKRGRKEKQGTPLKYKAECELSSTSVISRWASVSRKSLKPPLISLENKCSSFIEGVYKHKGN